MKSMKKIDMIVLCAIAIIVFLTGLFISTKLEACTAFLEDEYVDGSNRICRYDHLGSTYATTIKSYQICRITIYVEHD